MLVPRRRDRRFREDANDARCCSRRPDGSFPGQRPVAGDFRPMTLSEADADTENDACTNWQIAAAFLAGGTSAARHESRNRNGVRGSTRSWADAGRMAAGSRDQTEPTPALRALTRRT